MGEQRARRADEEAFVQQHEALVEKIARQLRTRFELRAELADLMGYGYSGLLEARERFDPARGVQFSTFAYYRIRGAILDGVNEMSYLPRHMYRRRRAAEVLDTLAEAALERRAAAPERRGDRRGTLMSIEDIMAKTCAAFVIAAIGQEQQPAPSPEASFQDKETRERILLALELLDPREHALVRGFYFENRTLEEVGEELGISRSWASRLHARALDRLRVVLEGG